MAPRRTEKDDISNIERMFLRIEFGLGIDTVSLRIKIRFRLKFEDFMILRFDSNLDSTNLDFKI